jgi:hypothetical protein
MDVAAEAQEHGACGLAFLEVQQLDGWLVVFPAVGRLSATTPLEVGEFRGTFLAIWHRAWTYRALLQCSRRRGNLSSFIPDPQNQVVVLASGAAAAARMRSVRAKRGISTVTVPASPCSISASGAA